MYISPDCQLGQDYLNFLSFQAIYSIQENETKSSIDTSDIIVEIPLEEENSECKKVIQLLNNQISEREQEIEDSTLVKISE